MFFKTVKEKQRLLKFFNDSHFNKNRQSENREDEIFPQLNPPINRGKLNIYLREFLVKEWIERHEKRLNAYRITDKGILHHSSSWSSKISGNQKIAIISIVISTILILLGFYLKHIGYLDYPF